MKGRSILITKGKVKDIFIRAAKTFAQAFLSAISVDCLAGVTDFGALKKIGLSALIAGVAAGASAVWNALAAFLSRRVEEMGGGASRFDDFIDERLGKAADYDGVCGVQCVDFIKTYMKYVLEINPVPIGNAHAYYDDYEKRAFLKDNFIRIANDPRFIPRRGDVCVWKKELNGGYGHIAVASGEGTARYFYSYEQNWGGKAAKKVKHDYRYFAGVLRPRDDSALRAPSGPKDARYYPKCDEKFKSIADALKSVGADGGYANRRKIAKANGVKGYRGTASQNIRLLSLLKRGELLKYGS